MLKTLRGIKSKTFQTLIAPPNPLFINLLPWKILTFFSITKLISEYRLIFYFTIHNVNLFCLYFSSFHATGLFLYLLKTSEHRRFYGVFREYGKTSGMKWVKLQGAKYLWNISFYVFFLKTDGGSYSPAWDVAVKWLLNEELEMSFKIRLFRTKVKLNFLSQIKSWVSSLLSRQLLFNGTSGTRNSKPGQIWQSMESQMESLIQDYYLVFQ